MPLTQSSVVRTASRLQEQALRMLRDRNIVALTEKLGETVVVGSLAYGLMVRKDIDLCVRLPKTEARERFVALGADLTNALSAHRSLYIDYDRYGPGAAGDESGLYLGLEFLYCRGIWKIDIWGEAGCRFEQSIAYSNRWSVRLRSCDRGGLLLLKAWAAKRVGYSSEAVYEAATQGIYRTDEFTAWLREQG
jgi:hypothetical protein